eukprot:5578571-Pleurochrysis_carterae.AAC.1
MDCFVRAVPALAPRGREDVCLRTMCLHRAPRAYSFAVEKRQRLPCLRSMKHHTMCCSHRS